MKVSVLWRGQGWQGLDGGLWGNRDFVMFWIGQSISTFGTMVTALALPLTVVITLGVPRVSLR